MEYVTLAESELPAGIRWSVPRQNQGQIVEVAYSDGDRSRDEACHGARYQRTVDQSIAVGSPGRVTYAVRADDKETTETARSLPAPTVHDPATYWQAVGLGGEGRTRAGDYVCYAPGAPSNSASYGPGRGATEREALLAACYWANQAARIRVVPARQAPQWAIDQAADRAARK